jgi:ubiquinone/menaquinone biosynthesis C-methylase UbiE
MPTSDWNKRYGEKIKKFVPNKKRAYYGIHWGDPSISGWRYWLLKLLYRSAIVGDLSKVVKHYITPYLTPQSVVLEIGAGGGRWTQYLLDAKELILVELNAEFFPYLKGRFPDHLGKMRFYQTNGAELAGIPSNSIDFVFTFGTLVQISPDMIDAYLGEIRRVLKRGGIAVIHYADKTKKVAQRNDQFTDMNAGKMEAFVASHQLTVRDHNRTLLNHSNLIVVQK